MSTAVAPPHAMMLPASSGDAAREAFWGEVQTYLEAEIRRGFRARYDAVVEPALVAQLGRAPDRHEIAEAMLDQDVNRAWYLARTLAQRRAFEASQAIVDGQCDELGARAAALGNGPARLELDPDLVFPSYVQGEVHNMAGGYADTVAQDPIAAGAVYDRALSIHRIAAMGPLVDDVGHSIAARLREQFPDFRPQRILELGCTVGHTLLPFKQAYPDAEVIGIDVSAPCLRYGAARAAALGVDATFSQRPAEATGYPDGHFDLVFSRILLHETGDGVVPDVFAECHRLLRRAGSCSIPTRRNSTSSTPIRNRCATGTSAAMPSPIWTSITPCRWRRCSSRRGLTPPPPSSCSRRA
ncbi:class I SAM-dependent methyltransferase [Sphingomonas sp. UYP23]